MQGLIPFVAVALATLLTVEGHSWITCTDYLENNGNYWDYNKCRAYARHGWKFTPKNNFGIDTGYDYVYPKNLKPCRTRRNDNEAYTKEYPMAVYYVGQKVVITHPTKNHVADVRCTNKYIPDNGNKIYFSTKDRTSDPTLEEFYKGDYTDLGTASFGHHIPDSRTTTYPKPGFQNAPKFCENPDKALATYTFTIPDFEAGRYTLMWAWWFNSAHDRDMYSSCWEADIVSTRQERDAILASRGHSTALATDAQN